MKILLINNDSMVKKLFEAVAKKLGLELVVQNNLKLPSTEDEFFLFVDEGVSGDYSSLLSSPNMLIKIYLHKRTSSPADGFEFYIKKPFLPTEVLDILKSRLADLGIDESTTSNLTKDDLAEIPEQSFEIDDFDLDELDELEGEEGEKQRGPAKPIPHISEDFDLEDLEEIQNVLNDLEKEKSAPPKKTAPPPSGSEDPEFDFIEVKDEDPDSAKAASDVDGADEGLHEGDEPDIDAILNNVKSNVQEHQEREHQERENQAKADKNVQDALSELSELIDDIDMDSDKPESADGVSNADNAAFSDGFGDDVNDDASDFALDVSDDASDVAAPTEKTIEKTIEKAQEPEHIEEPVSSDMKDDDFAEVLGDEISSDEENLEPNEEKAKELDSSILDKKQIDEVKKILEETQDEEIQNKENLMATPEQAKKIQEIQEQDIIDALGYSSKKEIDEIGEDMGDKDMKDTNEALKQDSQKEDFDIALDCVDDDKLGDILADKTPPASSDNSGANGIANLLNNTSIDGLKSILDGMQLTINISFPNKKK